MQADSGSDNHRENFRCPLQNIVGEYVYKGNLDKCEIMDISFDGVGIKISHVLPTSEVIDIRFQLPNVGKVYCKGKVVSVRGGRIGIQFINIPDKSQKNIKKQIENYTNQNIQKMLNQNHKKSN